MEFAKIVFGEEATLQYWLGYCFLYLFGVALFYVFKLYNRRNKSVRLSWTYFKKVNGIELILSIMLMYPVIRIYSDIYPYINDIMILKYDLTQVAGTILIGVFCQNLIKWGSKKLNLTVEENPEEFINKLDSKNE